MNKVAQRVVVGICGIGQGHSFRQSVVLTYLLARRHHVVALGFGESYRFLGDYFPQVHHVLVQVPWIFADRSGLDFSRTALDERNRGLAYIAESFAAMDQTLRLLGGKPDLVLTDYEPVSAQLAYALGKPLVCLDQQSKFLGFRTPDINGFSRVEEASRLRLFFPQATRRLASSFFPMTSEPDLAYPVTVLPPILRAEVRKLASYGDASEPAESDILVYLSPYGRTRQTLQQIIHVLREFGNTRFTVYSPQISADADCPEGNVNFRRFSNEGFLLGLKGSMAVICTAGHQLISEAVYLGKPILVLPFATYEQQYNAHMIKTLEMGVAAQELTVESLSLFLSSLPIYKAKLAEVVHSMEAYDGGRVVVDELSRDFDI